MHLATKFEQDRPTYLFDKKFNYKEVLAALSKSGAITEAVSLYNPQPKVEQVGIDQVRRPNGVTVIDVHLRNVSGKPIRVVVSLSRKDLVSPVEEEHELQLGPNETQRIKFDLLVPLSDIKLGYQALSLYPQEAYQMRVQESQILTLQREGLYALVGHLSAKGVTGITPKPNDVIARRVEYALTTQPAGLGTRRGKGDFEMQITGRPETGTFSLRQAVRGATLRLYDDGWRVTNCDFPEEAKEAKGLWIR
jgi:hypothetical protein